LPGDQDSVGFLCENRLRNYDRQMSCYLAFTDEDSVAAVRRNLSESPLVLENITNDGPKHCPSIYRKIIRFPDMVKHQIFVEPEGWQSEELYLQGLTTGMPPAAQKDIVCSVKGLENAVILRYGYAIEYDALAPGLIRKTMENRSVKGLYSAGQINGTSGYEEAAAQGLIAGINAALALKSCPSYWPSRTNSYIGVLVDDLSIWQKPEPYRITPGHAEFRLTLRDDSAERRLTEDGYRIGLVSEARYRVINDWKVRIEKELERLESLSLFPSSDVREKLIQMGTGDLKKRVSGCEILQRPGIGYSDLKSLLETAEDSWLSAVDEIYSIETEIKYSGYFERESEKIAQTRFLESVRLPLSVVDNRLMILSPQTIDLLTSDKYDDLNQLVRKNCLSRSELAILLAVLQQDSTVVGESEVLHD